jgi:hypothetical protein
MRADHLLKDDLRLEMMSLVNAIANFAAQYGNAGIATITNKG